MTVSNPNGLVDGEAFRYTLTEGGVTVEGVVTFWVGTELAGTAKVLNSRIEGVNFIIVFSAMPGTKWQIQKTASLASPLWTDIGPVNTADLNGYFQTTESMGSSGSGFYQAYLVK